jgi:hypothetical protein
MHSYIIRNMCIALCIRLSVISHPQPVDSPTHTTHRDGRERALSYYIWENARAIPSRQFKYYINIGHTSARQ